MATRSVATVFGGSGFIGRYVVQRLAAAGYVVRVAVRDPASGAVPQADGRGGADRAAVRLGDERADGRIARLQGADLVVNLVGILAERRAGDFQRIHAEGPGGSPGCRPPRACCGWCMSRRSAPIRPAPAATRASKAAGEAAVRRPFPRATILRPSIVFGPEDQFFNRFAAMAQMLPVMPVIAGGDAVPAGLCRRRGGCGHGGAGAARTPPGQLFELGGPRVWTFRELLAYVLEQTARRAADDRRAAGAGSLQARSGRTAAGQAAHPRPASDAAAGQRRERRTRRACRSWGSCRRRWNWSCRPILAAFRPGGRRMLSSGCRERDQIGPIFRRRRSRRAVALQARIRTDIRVTNTALNGAQQPSRTAAGAMRASEHRLRRRRRR